MSETAEGFEELTQLLSEQPCECAEWGELCESCFAARLIMSPDSAEVMVERSMEAIANALAINPNASFNELKDAVIPVLDRSADKARLQ